LVKIVDQIESIREIRILDNSFRLDEKAVCQSGEETGWKIHLMANVGSFFGHTTVTFDCKVFDFDLFDHLTMGEIDLQIEVIGLFRLQIESTNLALGDIASGQEWYGLAHTLKGAAAAVGAVQIVSLAHSWEVQTDVPDGIAKAQLRQLLDLLAGQYFAETTRVLEPQVKAREAFIERKKSRSA
jgi:HPt (histidine-containing phosphotransfer) domain-containing protein